MRGAHDEGHRRERRELSLFPPLRPPQVQQAEGPEEARGALRVGEPLPAPARLRSQMSEARGFSFRVDGALSGGYMI